MKVVFFASREESDVYEFPDGTTESELQDAADEWVAYNVGAGYEIIEDEEDDCT